MSDCQQCGMWVDPKKPYHPYAACLMFMGCKNGNTVQANLDGVVAHGAQYESGFDDLADRYAAIEARYREQQTELIEARKPLEEYLQFWKDRRIKQLEDEISTIEARCARAEELLKPLADCDPDIREWLGIARNALSRSTLFISEIPAVSKSQHKRIATQLGHSPACSRIRFGEAECDCGFKAETDYGCTGCRSTPCVCSTLETVVKCPRCGCSYMHDADHSAVCEGPQIETAVKSRPSFSGWIQSPCENCGKLSTEHPGIEMLCPTETNCEQGEKNGK